MVPVAIAGEKYLTRAGWVTLRRRDAAAAEAALVTADAAVAVLRDGGPVRCRAELAARLARWRELLWELAQARAARLGVVARCGRVVASSAYRPWGTSCALGTPFADPCGALDSQDDRGHWSGWAIDVPTRFTRESFAPTVEVAACWVAAGQAGLVRPFRAEYWHWRPASEP